jgi:hypothetical protein
MDKKLVDAKSANAIAGQKQEKDVAFFLRREFKDNPEVFVFNDYKFIYNDETAQIDHLILYKYGFILIESKSIAGEVKVNELGEWTRSYYSKWSGMPSPIKQVELQQKLFKEFLHHSRTDILGKVLGIRQQSFGGRSWNNICAVSSKSIIDRKNIPHEISNTIVKSEFLTDKLIEIMDLRSGILNKLNPLDVRPDFNEDELKSITNFLLSNIKNKVEKIIKEKEVEPEVKRAEVILKCKKCSESEEITPKYGKFGYYITCKKCEANTPMKAPCITCKSKKTKVSKKKDSYTLSCLDCESQRVLI